MPAEPVSEHGEDRGFVEGREALDPIAVVTRNQRGVVGKPAGTISIGPSATIIERLRKIPVIKTNPSLDSGCQQGIDEPIVEGEPSLIDHPTAGREDARPGDRKPVGPGPELAHEGDVLGIAMVVVAGDVPGFAIGDAALLPAERVPDAWPAPIFVDGALDLIARRGDTPDELPCRSGS